MTTWPGAGTRSGSSTTVSWSRDPNDGVTTLRTPPTLTRRFGREEPPPHEHGDRRHEREHRPHDGGGPEPVAVVQPRRRDRGRGAPDRAGGEEDPDAPARRAGDELTADRDGRDDP